MQVSLVWVRAEKMSPAVSACGSTDLYINTRGEHNEDSHRLCLKNRRIGTLHFPFVIHSVVYLLYNLACEANHDISFSFPSKLHANNGSFEWYPEGYLLAKHHHREAAPTLQNTQRKSTEGYFLDIEKTKQSKEKQNMFRKCTRFMYCEPGEDGSSTGEREMLSRGHRRSQFKQRPSDRDQALM